MTAAQDRFGEDVNSVTHINRHPPQGTTPADIIITKSNGNSRARLGNVISNNNEDDDDVIWIDIFYNISDIVSYRISPTSLNDQV